MQDMKIYHIAPALSKTGGGISEVLLNLCKVQIESGFSVSAFGGDLVYPDDRLNIKYQNAVCCLFVDNALTC